jgi:16S rRNA (cytosine1402-N4)-methyltransferase
MGGVMNPTFHQPVLRDEVIRWLITDPSGIYLDGTIGGGGHAEAIIECLEPSGILIGLDRDAEAVNHCQKKFQGISNVVVIQGSFADADLLLTPHNFQPLTSVLLDLGVSGYQLDTPSRGFSHRLSGPLDMRMDTASGPTAADLLNQASETDLRNLFYKFGQEKLSARIAKTVIRFRQHKPILTTDQLVEIVRTSTPHNLRVKSFSRIFQALRIYLNHELETLENGLNILWKLLAPHGRIVVISYHSLEDSMVKSFFRQHSQGCICPPEIPQCVCGKVPDLKILTPRVVRPSVEECKRNPRARAAKLRVAEKIKL